MLSRRKFISILGSSAVIVAAGKTAIDLDKMPSTAIAAWSGPKSTRDSQVINNPSLNQLVL